VSAPLGIQIALDLARMPALFRSSAAMALPSDVTEVIRIAAADEDACAAATDATGKSANIVVEAARLFVKQVLFRPEADCFRILGVSPGAPKNLARYHMRMLLAWLHPDRNRDGDFVFANRVLGAWREFSVTTEGDDGSRASAKVVSQKMATRRRSRLPLIPIENPTKSARHRRLWLFLLLGAIGFCAAAAATFPEKIYAIAQAVPFTE
jgi:hypothetical protein